MNKNDLTFLHFDFHRAIFTLEDPETQKLYKVDKHFVYSMIVAYEKEKRRRDSESQEKITNG